MPKAAGPRFISEFGSKSAPVIFIPLKVESPIVVSAAAVWLVPNETEVTPVRFANAVSPIVVSEFGSERVPVRPVRAKAASPMLVSADVDWVVPNDTDVMPTFPAKA